MNTFCEHHQQPERVIGFFNAYRGDPATSHMRRRTPH
jgi:hypothetical protein